MVIINPSEKVVQNMVITTFERKFQRWLLNVKYGKLAFHIQVFFTSLTSLLTLSGTHCVYQEQHNVVYKIISWSINM